MTTQTGMLYLCATPIGNLEDITLRVLRILQEADLIACEDTRQSRKLLEHYDIHKPLMSYHDHSSEQASTRIVQAVAAGQVVALMTDAGMPGISDPGFELIAHMRDAALPYTVLPGASAALTALVLSGLPSDRFLFEGFLPRKNKPLSARLAALDAETATTILYESPHRLVATLATLAARWPTRELAAVREISKRFEEVVRGTTCEVHDHFEQHSPRGEFVLILKGANTTETDQQPNALAYAKNLLEEGLSTNQAAKIAAERYQVKKRDIYQQLLEEDDPS